MCWSTATRPMTRRARRKMIARLIEERLDMVVAARVDREEAAYRLGHRTGNRLLTGFVAHVFGRPSPTCCRATGCSPAGS